MTKLIRTLDDLYYHPNNWPESLIRDIDEAYQYVYNVAQVMMGIANYGQEKEKVIAEWWKKFHIVRDRRISAMITDAVAEPVIFLMLDDILVDNHFASQLARDESRLRKLDAEAQTVRRYAVRFIREELQSTNVTTGEAVAIAIRNLLSNFESMDDEDFPGHHSLAFSNLGSELVPWITERQSAGAKWAKKIKLDKMPNVIFSKFVDVYPMDLDPVENEGCKEYAIRAARILLDLLETDWPDNDSYEPKSNNYESLETIISVFESIDPEVIKAKKLIPHYAWLVGEKLRPWVHSVDGETNPWICPAQENAIEPNTMFCALMQHYPGPAPKQIPGECVAKYWSRVFRFWKTKSEIAIEYQSEKADEAGYIATEETFGPFLLTGENPGAEPENISYANAVDSHVAEFIERENLIGQRGQKSRVEIELKRIGENPNDAAGILKRVRAAKSAANRNAQQAQN